MMQWKTLFKKEMLESWRNYKWIWVPLVMILLAIMDPISTYYLPQIIESVGGLPEGAVIEIPNPLGSEVVMMSLGQLSSLGVLVIVLMSMGTIANEYKSGVSELILVKPVSYLNYVTSKWASLLMIVWISFGLAMMASGYYINILFGDLSFVMLLYVLFFYGLWLMFVVTLSIFYNTLFKTPGMIATSTIATILGMSVLTSVFGKYLIWSPNHLSSHIHEMLVMNKVTTDIIATSIVTVVVVGCLLVGGLFIFRKRALS